MSRRSDTGRQRGIQKPSAINKNARGSRHTLSIEAKRVLSNLLEDIIEKTLEEARKMAETAGKSRLSIGEIERALKTLCQRFRSSCGPNGIVARIVDNSSPLLNRKSHTN